MRLLFVDKTAVLADSHERYERAARLPGCEPAVLSPTRWREHMREVPAERTSHPDYRIFLGRTFWTGSYSRGFYLTGLAKALKSFQPDVIQLLEEPWSLFAGQTVRLARRIVPEARLFFYTWENVYRDNTYRSKLDPIHRRIERTVFERATGAICATRIAEEVVRRKGFDGPTRSIPYGVSSSFLVPEEEFERRFQRPLAGPPRVGYVGRLLPMKGIDTLVEAVSGLDCELILLGGGPDWNRLEELGRELGLTDRLRRLDAVPPEEVAASMADLDVLVLPSRTTPTWAEQLGRVLLEAMALGVPVVGSSSGSIPEVLGDAGLVFQEGNADELREALTRILTDGDLRQGLSRKGRERVLERYTWERFVTDLWDEYWKFV